MLLENWRAVIVQPQQVVCCLAANHMKRFCACSEVMRGGQA